MSHFWCLEGFNFVSFWRLFLGWFTGVLLLDVLLGGLILAHCLTVFWTSSSAFVLCLGVHLRRSQGIVFALDALVGGFDQPMLSLLQATLAGLSAVSSTECGEAYVHAAQATIACA